MVWVTSSPLQTLENVVISLDCLCIKLPFARLYSGPLKRYSKAIWIQAGRPGDVIFKVIPEVWRFSTFVSSLHASVLSRSNPISHTHSLYTMQSSSIKIGQLTIQYQAQLKLICVVLNTISHSFEEIAKNPLEKCMQQADQTFFWEVLPPIMCKNR